MQVANSPASMANSFFDVSKMPRLLSHTSAMSSSARPESMADATNSGPMMALCQPSRAICRAKIHAVTVCTRMAMGRAKREMILTIRGLARFEVMKYRYRMLMTR